MRLAVSVVPIIIAITFHEVAHGYAAYRLGDPTAKMLGRLTLDPLKHIDPVGTVLMPLLLFAFGLPPFGYAKPVPIGVRNFKQPRRDMAITGLAGPGMNIALAIVSALLLRFLMVPLLSMSPGPVTEGFFRLFIISAQINIWLAALNLIPVPPLDGSRALAYLLPKDLAMKYDRLEPYGMFIFYGLILTGLYRFFMLPMYNILMSVFVNPILDPIFRTVAGG